MARAIIPLIIIGAIGLGLWAFWNPSICSNLNQIPNVNFDFCSFTSGSNDHSAPSPEPGVLTGGRHPHHRHRHSLTPSPKRITGGRHPHNIHPHAPTDPVTKQITGGRHPHTVHPHGPTDPNLVTSSNLAQLSHFRMSYN